MSSDPELLSKLSEISRKVIEDIFEKNIITAENPNFVLSLLDTISEKCVYQVLHTDFDVNDTDIVDNPNIKLVIFPLANDMYLRVVNRSHKILDKKRDAEGYFNGHFHHTNVVKIKPGEYICFHPRLWHSGWTTKHKQNYRVHLYVGFDSQSLDAVSKKYEKYTGVKDGDNLFFPIDAYALKSLTGEVRKNVSLNAHYIHKTKRVKSLKNLKHYKIFE